MCVSETSQTIHVSNWHMHRKYLVEVPDLNKIIPVTIIALLILLGVPQVR